MTIERVDAESLSLQRGTHGFPVFVGVEETSEVVAEVPDGSLLRRQQLTTTGPDEKTGKAVLNCSLIRSVVAIYRSR